MHALRTLARTALHRLNGIEIFRRSHARDLRILMYHDFAPDSPGFRNQCAHIRRYYTPVSMGDVARSLATNDQLPSNALAVTVDDGYRNFLLYGYPVFREFEIPATVYLVSDFLDRKCWLWWNEIQYAIEKSRDKLITVEILNARYSLPIATAAEQAHACSVLIEALKSLPNSERQTAQTQIIQSLNVALPADPPPKWEPLTWEEVRCLSRDNVEFGAHTRRHPILSSVQDRDEMHEEIAGSKRRLEQELGVPILHFCYPNGRTRDIGPEVLQHTRACGFQTAVTTEHGMNRLSEANPLALRRLGVDPGMPDFYFAELLAGFRKS